MSLYRAAVNLQFTRIEAALRARGRALETWPLYHLDGRVDYAISFAATATHAIYDKMANAGRFRHFGACAHLFLCTGVHASAHAAAAHAAFTTAHSALDYESHAAAFLYYALQHELAFRCSFAQVFRQSIMREE